ncbi:unnamed protein product, partial [Ectocarpus fasciculatus]
LEQPGRRPVLFLVLFSTETWVAATARTGFTLRFSGSLFPSRPVLRLVAYRLGRLQRMGWSNSPRLGGGEGGRSAWHVFLFFVRRRDFDCSLDSKPRSTRTRET